MFEQLSAHVAFHLRAHHVPLIIDEQVAHGLESDQREHGGAQRIDLVERVVRALFCKQVLGDEIRTDRQQQGCRRYDEGAEKICEKQPSIRLVIGEELSGSRTRESGRGPLCLPCFIGADARRTPGM